jgi:hypothetical protein
VTLLGSFEAAAPDAQQDYHHLAGTLPLAKLGRNAEEMKALDQASTSPQLRPIITPWATTKKTNTVAINAPNAPETIPPSREDKLAEMARRKEERKQVIP